MKTKEEIENEIYKEILNKRIFEIVRDKLNFIMELVDEAQKLTINMGFIEHYGEIKIKVVEIKLLLKELEKRFAKKQEEGK